MSVQPQANRPRCKDPRIEAVLRGVERGSDGHVAQWAEQGQFPTEPHDGAIALRSVFKLLDEEDFPEKPLSMESPSAHIVKLKIRRIVGWMDIIGVSLRRVNRRDPSAVGKWSQIYEEYFYVLLRWLKFYMRHASWLFTWDVKDGDQIAPRVTAETLHNLHHCIHTGSLLDLMHNSEEAIDLLLSVWMWQDRKGRAIYLSYHPSRSENKTVICPIISLFTQFCLHNTSQMLVWERVAGLTRREHDRFMRCTLSRMEQWTPPPRAQLLSLGPINGLETLIFGVCSLLDISGMARAFTRHNIAGNALKLAIAQGDIPTLGPAWAQAPFALKLGHSFFFTKSSSVMGNLQHRVIIDLLKAGFLNVILDDMFERHERNPNAFPFYTSADTDRNERNPLTYLAPFCVHRQVCEATCDAIDAVPDERLDTLEAGWAAEYWAPFVQTVALFDSIWSRVPATQITLCDNLKHQHTAEDAPPKAKECSRCRSVVYCSATCQEQDWELHKVECPIYRVHRTDLELRSAWESHKTRVFFLHLLQQLLLNLVSGHSLLTECGTLSEDGSTLSLTHEEAEGGDDEDEEDDASDSEVQQMEIIPPMVQFDVRQVPLIAQAQQMDESTPQRASEILGTLGDKPSEKQHPRFGALIREALAGVSTGGETTPNGEDGETEGDSGAHKVLALCLSSLGPYRIVTFGRFSVACDAEKLSVTLLNGYMKVEPGENFIDLY